MGCFRVGQPGPEGQGDPGASRGLPPGLTPEFSDPSSSRCSLFLLVSTHAGDRVFSKHLPAEKANIQKYFDNDILQFPEAVRDAKNDVTN